MTHLELLELIHKIGQTKCETQTLEIKAAADGCPKRLYDTLSSFSNQDDGGVILFGIDEDADFAEVGVYDAQDLMTRVKEQCDQMEPKVRPIFTTAEQDGNFFASAEIPGIDISERPCFYQGKGRIKGSYVRVGVTDEPMTEYEVYSYEAFRKKYQDDVRPIERATLAALDRTALDSYLLKLKRDKHNLAQIGEEKILELMSITRNGKVTVSALLLFCPFPQAFFPQLSINAVVVPGTEVGELSEQGARFLDNRRIEGPLTVMLEGALAFVRNSTKHQTIIDPDTGKRMDKSDYPMVAVREAVLNALVHRDYSPHTEGMPIQLYLFEDRFELRNPGGIYGRIQIDQLGKVQPDTRNPVLAVAMEVLNETENRYLGIPTMRRELVEAGMPEPEFAEERGTFVVRFRKTSAGAVSATLDMEARLLSFCKTPRSRAEIAEFLGVKTEQYAIQRYVMPLVEQGLLAMTVPDKPRSKKQRYIAAI